ncbi:MAG: polysaccharide deacetylase family protein, partial [Clostridia bacterium]|nr:polysaccharide deacetylase family protein [Clostridia bacterium]
EVLDVENVYFGDPSIEEVQNQPYIIISQRKRTEELKALAKRYGRPQSEIEAIGDSDSDGEKTTIFLEDLESCNEKIKAITGKTPTLYRGPYGEYDDKTVTAVNNLGMHYIQWSADTVDWKKENTSKMQIENVTKRISSGGIILMHNGTEHTVETLAGLLENLTNAGYRFVPVTELIFTKNYSVDQNGVQHKT